MKYTEVKYKKRVANPNAKWVSDALQSSDISSHIEELLYEMKFEKRDINYHLGDVRISFSIKDECISFYLTKNEGEGKEFCALSLHDYKGKLPIYKIYWEESENIKGSERDIPLNLDYQHRFIDTIIECTRTLWKII